MGLRIAFFSESFREDMGGMTRAVIQAHDALVARGHRVQVFTLAQSGGPLHPGETVPIRGLPLPAVGGLAADNWLAVGYRTVLEELERRRPDVVHLHSPFPVSWMGLAAARRIGVPVVATYHANLTGAAALWFPAPAWLPGAERVAHAAAGVTGRLARFFYDRADLVIAPSPSAGRSLRALELRARVEVASNGVDTERFLPEWLAADRARPPRSHGRPVVLYAGRLSREKGMEALMDAIDALLRSETPAAMHVVGDGPYRSLLEQRFRDAMAAGRVILAGHVPWDSMPQVYQAADVLLFPSPVETQGLVVLEAMASGLPVAGVRAGAIPDVVRDGENGVLVEPGDGAALARAALWILSDERRRSALAREARRTALGHALDRVAGRLEELYASVLRRAQAPLPGASALHEPPRRTGAVPAVRDGEPRLW